MELKNEIEKQRLYCLQILNTKFVNEGNIGCLTDRQVKLVLDAMFIVLQENSMENYKKKITQEEIKELAVAFSKTQVVRGINLPEWDDKTEELISRYFIAAYNQALKDNSENKYTEEDMNNFAKFYINNKCQYDDDSLALKKGLYLKQYEQSKNGKNG